MNYYSAEVRRLRSDRPSTVDGRVIPIGSSQPQPTAAAAHSWRWVVDRFYQRVLGHVGVPREDLEWLKMLNPSEVLFMRRFDLVVGGADLRYVYFIRDGWAANYTVLEDGRRQIINFLLPGDIAGFPHFLGGGYEHSVAAVERVRAFALPVGQIREALDRRPRVGSALQWASFGGMLDLREQVVRLGRRCAYERIAHLVAELYERLGFLGLADSTGFRWPITQEDLADALGMTAVHANRTLRRLEQDDLIRRQGNRVIIRDLSRLISVANYCPLQSPGLLR